MRALIFVVLWLAFGVSNAVAANAIVTENQLPGTPRSQWDLNGPASTSLQGFATDISVNHGSTINFKIQASTTSWRIDIYRLGYYQGNGARLIGTIPKTTAQTQPAPIVNASTGEVDAGNWAVTASLPIPASAISGVYIAKLVDQNTPGNESHIPFIVRADESVSDILFQTSDTTWQAYNGWGGANLYGGNGPGADSAPGRAYKVSYNRPFATRDGVGAFASWTDFLFGAEYSAIFWLEQNGYDVSYIAEVDTARSGSSLLQHKIFTSTGHDEYWDTVARANVEAARAAGVNLAFMSGNEVYWKTRWEPSIDGSATPYRTLVCYKETRSTNGPIDPLDASPTWIWTGTWRDPRNSPPADGKRPENALTGTIFQVDSYRSDAIQVPLAMSRLRFWRNTPNVSKASSGATTTLTQNILGYEWDISPDNGFAPAGLINLSSTTVDVSTLLLDYGATDGNGTATHNLTLYKDRTNGAIVFGAGTVFWAWGLADVHDGPTTATDPDVQQAMVNLFADMGVQPATLQPPLIAASKSTDTTPPVSHISTPAGGASFVEGQPVVISGVASDVGGQVAGVEVSVDNGATWRRASGATSWTLTWNATAGPHTIRSRATDDSLNTETPASGSGVSVASGGTTLFAGVSVPDALTVSDGNAIELGMKFSSSSSGFVTGLRFYKNSINSSVHVGHLWDSGGNLLASATFANETASGWQQVNFSSPVQITAGAIYTASYHTSGFYSAADSYFAAPLTNGPLTAPVSAGVYAYGPGGFPAASYHSDNYWVDVVFAASSGSQPSAITSSLTASGAVGSPFSYTITASNNPTSFNAVGLPAGLSVNTTTGVISGTPTAAGTSNVTLSATNAVGTGTATLVLTINASGSTISLFSTSSVPAIVTVNDPSSVELGVKFSAANAGSITGMRFYKGPQNTGPHTAHLWSAAGVLLASATFGNESASGWQTVSFASPVAISANTTYVASYHTNNGFYSANGAFFGAPYTNPPLSAPDSASSGGNGVYAYGGDATFPSNTYNSTNYWVDVIFTASSSGSQPSAITSSLTASGAVGSPFSYTITASNNPTSFNAVGLPAGLSVNTTTGVISGTPTAAGTSNVTLSATNAAGTGTATLVLTINASGSTISLFSTSSVPAIVTVNDPSSVELGVKFSTANAGSITGMRFYKGAQNTGTHTAHLWNAAGTLLASATFSNESTSGWQTVSFVSPVAISANTTYVASYHTNGFYSASGAFFGSSVVDSSLTAPDSASSGGNGVYAYGSSVAYPSNTYNATNYWVDVLFQ